MATGPSDEDIVADFEATLSTESKMRLDTSKKDRAVSRAKLTRALNLMENAMKETDPSTEEIEFLLEKVKSVYNELEMKDMVMYVHLDSIGHVQEADQRMGNHYYERSCKAIGQAKKVIKSLESSSSTASGSTASTTSTAPSLDVKLPKIDLPMFKGESPSEY